MTDDPKTRLCVNGLKPDAPVKVPAESEFDVGSNYKAAPEIEATIETLMRTAGRNLGDVLEAEVSIGARWTRKGARSYGDPVVASITKCGGRMKFETGRDYLVYVAADHLRALLWTHWQLEACIFHELEHIRVDTDTDGNTTLSLRGHDVEAFADELTIYGPWNTKQVDMRETMKQAPLFGDIVANLDKQRKAADAAAKTEGDA